MTDYITLEVAIAIADYAVDEHPYDKDPERPETFSEYNQGWHDACDYIRDKLEAEKPADVEPVRNGRWIGTADGYADGQLVYDMWECSECGFDADGADERPDWAYCPNCGVKMDLEDENGE